MGQDRMPVEALAMEGLGFASVEMMIDLVATGAADLLMRESFFTPRRSNRIRVRAATFSFAKCGQDDVQKGEEDDTPAGFPSRSESP